MAIEFKNPADAVREQGIKMLVYGAAGSGKTVLCATANEPTLIISTEAGLLSIKDAPKRIQIVECNTGEEVDEVLDYLSQNKLPNWVCIDSISEIAEVVLAEELTKTKDPRKAYGELAVIMTALVKRFRNLHTNVVMTAKVDKVKDDMAGGLMYSPGMPGQKLGNQLGYFFDLVCAMRVTTNTEGNLVRELQTNRDGQWEAKDRSGKLDIFEPQNLAALKSKIYGDTATKKAA